MTDEQGKAARVKKRLEFRSHVPLTSQCFFVRGLAMRTVLVLLACCAAALYFGVAEAEPLFPADRDQRDRFQLFNECKPVHVRIVLDEDATSIGLDKDSLKASMESRLRSAKLYGMSPDLIFLVPALVLQVDVSSRAFVVGLEYFKAVCHDATGECGPAPTWSTASFGTHGDDGGYIRSSVAERIDQFIAEYLRVNEEVCGSEPTASEFEPFDAVKIMRDNSDPNVDYGAILDQLLDEDSEPQ